MSELPIIGQKEGDNHKPKKVLIVMQLGITEDKKPIVLFNSKIKRDKQREIQLLIDALQSVHAYEEPRILKARIRPRFTKGAFGGKN